MSHAFITHPPMDWRPYISATPGIAGGRPIVTGTRLGVDFLLGLLSEGWTEADIEASYPSVTPQVLRAALAFAADALRGPDTAIARPDPT